MNILNLIRTHAWNHALNILNLIRTHALNTLNPTRTHARNQLDPSIQPCQPYSIAADYLSYAIRSALRICSNAYDSFRFICLYDKCSIPSPILSVYPPLLMPLLVAIIQSLALLLPLLRYERLNFRYPYKQPYYHLYSRENIIIIAPLCPYKRPYIWQY